VGEKVRAICNKLAICSRVCFVHRSICDVIVVYRVFCAEIAAVVMGTENQRDCAGLPILPREFTRQNLLMLPAPEGESSGASELALMVAPEAQHVVTASEDVFQTYAE
jgi:hypothetical protein